MKSRINKNLIERHIVFRVGTKTKTLFNNIFNFNKSIYFVKEGMIFENCVSQLVSSCMSLIYDIILILGEGSYSGIGPSAVTKLVAMLLLRQICL